MHETFDVTYHGRQAAFNAQRDLFIYKTYHHAVPQPYILQKMLTSYPLAFSGPEIEIILWESKESCSSEGKAIPLQAWRGSEGSRRLRLLDFMTNSTWWW